MQNPLTVCGRSYEDFLNTIQRFHGWIAPGVVIGGLMVDLAQEHIGPDVEADAIMETIRCLPDAIQLFTSCTYGNGWMTVLSSAPVRVVRYYGKIKKGKIEICPKCGEAYPTSQGDWCLACQGKGYYEMFT